MFKQLFGQRKYLAVITTVIVLVQTLLPGGSNPLPANPALASDSSKTWNFDNAADYALDPGLSLFDYDGSGSGVLQTKITGFSDAGVNGLIGLDVSAMTRTSSGRIWATANVMGRSGYSDDDGVTWHMTASAVLLATRVYDFTATTAGKVFAVGASGGNNPRAAYSSDNGATWQVSTLPGGLGLGNFMASTYDAVNGNGYAVGVNAGVAIVFKTADDGANFASTAALNQPGDVIAVRDIECAGSNTIATVGANGVGGAMNFTTDGGTSWSQGVFPAPPAMVLTLGYVGGYLYTGGSNYLARINIAGGGQMNQVGDWTDISGGINGGVFAAGLTQIFGGKNSNVVFLVAILAAGRTLYSSLDHGAHWLLHETETVANTRETTVWNSDGSKLIWGGNNGAGAADVWIATTNPTNTSAIITNGFSASRLTSITANYQALNYSEVYVSFSNTNPPVDGGKWYYYSGGAWQSSSVDSISKATAIGDLTPAVLATLPISDTVLYVKLYPKDNNAFIALDSLVITYAVGGGGGGDTTPPVSSVNPLPQYSTVTDPCHPLLSVSATATDADGSVKTVELFISTDGGETFTSWASGSNPAIAPPYHWNVPVESGMTYYFYSIATDFAGHIEDPPTNPGWDTFTTVDFQPPYLLGSTPSDGWTDVSITQSVILDFSEPILPESFHFEFTPADSPGSPVGSTSVQWGLNNQTATIVHDSLGYSTRYRFSITSATDLAGNQIIGSPLRCPGRIGTMPIYPPLEFFFTTQVRMDPDLLDSTLTVADGPNGDGSYNPGDHAQFTLTLSNKSTFPANNVAAKLTIVDGLTYVRTDDAGGGTMKEIRQAGKVVALEWRNRNPIIQGHPVVVKFTLKVNSPALVFSITQTVNIYDNVNFTEEPDKPLVRSAILTVARGSNFEHSAKTVDKSDAQPGDVLTYTVTITNSGNTPADAQITDRVPSSTNTDGQPAIFFKSIVTDDPNYHDQRWIEPPHYDDAIQTILARANGLLPPNYFGGSRCQIPEGCPDPSTISFQFQAVIRDTASGIVTNTAEVWDPNITPSQKTELSASTTVPGKSKPDTTPLVIAYQNPAPNSVNNRFKQSIQVGFNKSVVTNDDKHPFTYTFSEEGVPISGGDLADWNPTWSTWNGHDNAMFTLMPPSGELDVGAVYQMTIVSATDTYGLSLTGQPVSWEFTTASPITKIVYPQGPFYELLVNTLSERFEINLIDDISGQPYIAEDDVNITLKAYLGGLDRESGSFWASPTQPLDKQNPHITIKQGTNTGGFYYKDGAVSVPDYVTVRVFESQWRGWYGDEKYVWVEDQVQPLESLIIHAPAAAGTGQFSNPITLTATKANGQSRSLPQGRLYFYTDGNGAFYDSNYQQLAELASGHQTTGGVTTQGVEPQYLDINSDIASLTLYYLSDGMGQEIITASDNNPQWPDTGLNDASAVINIQAVLEKPILKELEEVDDNTGRIANHLTLVPDKAEVLPNGKQDFTVTAYDTDGKKIDGLKYNWFVLMSKSGTIEKKGHNGSSISTFTAGQTLGTYYDDVLVAAIYNGKLVYATATVKVVDVVNYKGPKRLPVTGINGLQLVLMALTLLAAVALAWVEHYDKTHFKPNQ